LTFYLFHQNMRSFGGGTTAYNNRMKKAFGEIPIGGADKTVLAAGFTEVKNSAMAPIALGGIAKRLDIGLTKTWTVVVGCTGTLVKDPDAPPAAKKAKTSTTSKIYTREYITMVTQYRPAEEFEVLHWGKALFLDSITTGPSPAACFPAGGLNSPAATELPTNAKVDSRGLAYIVGRVRSVGDPLHNKLLVVCFMHNMYGVGDRSSGLTGVPSLVSTIYAAHAADIDPVRDPCIIGGDFNAEPRAVGRGGNHFEPQAETSPTGNYYRTTGSSVYDWWLCRADSLDDAKPEIWMQTYKKNKPILSDHAGISLGLDVGMWW